MKESIQQLRERRSAIAKAVNALMNEHPGERWGEAQQRAYDEHMAEIERVGADIARKERYLAVIAEEAASGRPGGLLNETVRTPGAHGGESRGMRAYLAGGVANMSEDDRREMMARRTPDIQNTMSTAAGGEGGYTVATEYYRQLTQAMRAYGGIREVATVIQTSTGGPMNFPAADATMEEGEIVGQNQQVNAQDTTFQNLVLPVFKYSSKSIAIPFELLQDSMFDMETYIRGLLALRLGRITAKHHAIGDGANQPAGLVRVAKVGRVAPDGQVDKVTYDDLVELEHSVDPTYRAGPKVGWLMNDTTLKTLRKIKDDHGRPIFVPGYEQGNPSGAPDRLLNRPIHIAQEVPAMGANARSIGFGDLSRYFIREVMDLTLFRMADSKYIEKGQVGFLGFNRQGGNLIDVGGAIKFFQNAGK
ncbi:MAG: phage major capsid protein [Janthinobacterium lividum]